MLLGFFRINDPYRLLGVILIVALLGIPQLIYPPEVLLMDLKYSIVGEAVAQGKWLFTQVIDDTAPVFAMSYGVKDLIFGRSLVAIKVIALLIVIFQSAYFAILLINNKAYTENTYVPALIFALLNFISFDVLSLSPELLGSTVLLLALNQLFHEVEFKIQRDDIVLKLGFYLGISTLFLFSYWPFLIICTFILIAFARATFRKIMLMLFGFALPHLMFVMIYFYRGELGMLWSHFYLPNLTFSGEMLVSTKALFVISAIPLAYFVFSIFMMNREARFTKYQSQLMQIMFLWTLTAVAQVLIARSISPASLLPTIPPFAYFISHYLLLIRRRWRAELMTWLLLIGIVSINFLAQRDRLSSVNYDALFVKKDRQLSIMDKKIMNLGDEIEVYSGNIFGGIFLNWKLSAKYFTNLSDYKSLELVASCFAIDPPEVIVDPDDSFREVLKFMPDLRGRYRRSGNYWLLSN